MRGDDTDFAAFMATALPGLLRFGHVLTGDPVRGEELVQSALVKTWLRSHRLDLDQPAAYVRRAMVTTYTSWWRRTRREAPLPDGWDAAAAPDPDGAERERTMQALRVLPPRQRAVIVLRYYEDLSEADIAAALGCSPGTVKSQASRPLRTLRTHLSDREEAPA